MDALAPTSPTLHGFRRAAERVLPYFFFGYLPLLLIGAVAVGTLTGHWLWDFRVFLRAGHDVLDGVSPYPPPVMSRVAHENTFVYPPETALAFVPLALLPFHAAASIFLVLLFASVPLTLWALGVRDWRCYGVAFLMAPVFGGIVNGALSVFLALGLALAWRYRESWKGAAVAVALVIVIKVFLWPLLVWLVATRRYAAALAATVGGALVTLAAWAVLGFAGIRDYVHLLRMLADAEQAKGFSPIALGLSLGLPSGWARGVALTLGAVALIGVVLLARRPDGDRLSLTAAVGAALLLSPIVWLHYFTVLLVPLALARPRYTPLWLLPAVAFWFTGGQSGGNAAPILIAFVTAGATLAFCILGKGIARPRILARRPTAPPVFD
jgi:alpha-1,2-mannosyltransferase